MRLLRHNPLFTTSRRALALLATTLLLASCGAIKIGYNHADTVGLYYLDQYFDLDDDQEAVARTQIRALVAWHRQHELPLYSKRIEALKLATAREATADDFNALDQDLMGAIDRLIGQAAPNAAELLGGLSDQQVRHLRDRFDKDDAKFRSDWVSLTPARLRDKIYDRTLEQFERWYGEFSTDQRKQIRAMSDARPFDATLALSERERRQREFMELVDYLRRAKPSQADVVSHARAFSAHWPSTAAGTTDPAKSAAQRESALTMIVAVANLATPEQRKTAADRLQKWIDDLASLSASK